MAEGAVSKRCPKCGEVKPRGEFHCDKSRADGLTRRCRVCVQEYGRKYREAHKAEAAARYKQWRVKNRDRANAHNRQHYATHRRAIATRHRQWHAENKNKANARSKQYCRELYESGFDVHGRNCEACGRLVGPDQVASGAQFRFHHRHFNGDEHRKRCGRGGALCDWRDRGWPADECQLLCNSCHRKVHNQHRREVKAA